MHGPTFMANPLACAAANASLDLFEREPRLDQVAAIAGALRRGPRALPEACRASRTCGSRAPSAWSSSTASRISTPCANALLAEGVFIRPFGNVVYLTPAFTIAEDELAELMDAVRRVLAERV